MQRHNVHTQKKGMIPSFPWILLILLFVPTSLGAATLSFQNGVLPDASYLGMEDTYVYAQNKNTNYGGEQGMGVNGIGFARRSSILEWDISAIPSSAVVTGAEITVVVGDPSLETYNIYEMKRPWVESMATWSVYSTGKSWQIEGASGAFDRGIIPLGTTTTGSGQQTYTLNPDGVARIQQWVTDPTSNMGMIIQNYNNTDLLAFSSSEETNMAKRPKLTITYRTGMVSGKVYDDANHNKALDGAETGFLGVTVELFSMPDNTLMATQITTADGSYQFTGMADGSYEVRQRTPAGYVATTPDTLAVTLSNGEAFSDFDFGDFAGAQIMGTVFPDTGAGGGISNNGLQDGAEAGIVGVSIRATDPADTILYDQTVTDMNGAYTLWVDTPVTITVIAREANPANYISTTPDTITLSVSPGDNLSFKDFGDVPPLVLTPNGSQMAPPGGIALYAHRLTAGTAGQVTLSATSTPGLLWTFYKDANGNGQFDHGETALTSADLNMTAGQTLMFLARAQIPTEVTLGTIDVMTLSAKQTFVNSPLTTTQTATDTTTMAYGNLKLIKAASVTTARPGDLIDYTLTYENIGTETLATIVIYDQISEYLDFMSSVPPLDLGFPDAEGRLRWTISGTLKSGQSELISYTVQVQ